MGNVWSERREEMRYVTCYDSFLGGLIGVVFHDSKEEAVKCYRKEAKFYFHGLRLPKKIDVPSACGFPHRQFMVMSIRKFKLLYPKYKGVPKCHPKK
jgi:hypothetical protein